MVMWLAGGENGGKVKNSRVQRRVLAGVLARYTRHPPLIAKHIRQSSEKNRKYQTNFLSGRFHQKRRGYMPGRNARQSEQFLKLSAKSLFRILSAFRIQRNGCISGAIFGGSYVTFVDVIWSKWNWKLKEGKNFFLVEGLIVAYR